MVRFGLQQVLQLLTSLAAVAVFFFHQRQQEPVIEVGIAQEEPAFGAEFVLLCGWPTAARAAQRELRFCALCSGFGGLRRTANWRPFCFAGCNKRHCFQGRVVLWRIWVPLRLLHEILFVFVVQSVKTFCADLTNRVATKPKRLREIARENGKKGGRPPKAKGDKR